MKRLGTFLIILSMGLLFAHTVTPHDHTKSFTIAVTEHGTQQHSFFDLLKTAFLYANPGDKHLEEYNQQSETDNEAGLDYYHIDLLPFAQSHEWLRSAGSVYFYYNKIDHKDLLQRSSIKDRAPPAVADLA